MIEQPEKPLSAALTPLGSLGLYTGRTLGNVVGRPRELEALTRGLAAARSHLTCIVLEGEPGIGKTRLLLAIEEQARHDGFLAVAVTADEEIRGPLLLARSIFGSPAMLEAVVGTPAEQPLKRAIESLSTRDEAGFESMSPDRRLVRVLDLAAVALQALAAQQPIALLLDDVQWADEDSLRILRYLVRTHATSPIFLVLATRPDETALVNEAVTLFADLDRIGLLQRLRLSRFSQVESAEFLQQVLGGEVNFSSAAVMHAQAEGVPFILAEQAHAYREAGMIQQIDGVWTLARNAQRLLPSAVKTLIQRRAARLPADTKAALAEAAVLGRRFSLRDLCEVRRHLGEGDPSPDALIEVLSAAAEVGLLVQHEQGEAADYTFTHEQVREYAASTLPAARRRAIHTAIVEMLTSGGEPPPEFLALLAQHALAAGQNELCTRVSIEAAKAALRANAPEEALRLVELAQPITTSPQDRVTLLCLRDEALGMLRRPEQRLEGLTEVTALAEALGDTRLEFEVTLRRAAALRLSDDHDIAADLARRVRDAAREQGDAEMELAACLELGQDLLRTEIGESTTPVPAETDMDGAWEAFERAVELAEQLNDERSIAAATRELGVIGVARLRVWFVGLERTGGHLPILQELAGGKTLADIIPTLPVRDLIEDSTERLHRALEIYERLGDRQGTMATIIALATASWAPEIHTSGSVERIEEIRRLFTRMKSMTRESERALAEAQMLYGAHIYAIGRIFVDAAIEKGSQAYQVARTMGDRSLEFAAAGGTALACVQAEDFDEAVEWLERAASVASASPTPFRARQLELWRGTVRWAAGDAEGMRKHLGRAIELTEAQGHAAGRCEALAQLAIGAAWLGSEQDDEALLALAERSAHEAKALAQRLPGHPLWGAEGDAALARVALHRGEREAALAAGRAAMAAYEAAIREDLPLHMLLPAAEAIVEAGTPEEAETLRMYLRLFLALIAQRISDEGTRARWFRSRFGAAMTRIAGPLDASVEATAAQPGLHFEDEEKQLLRLITEGQTNDEIAATIGCDEEAVAQRLAVLFAKIGAGSRADATSTALIRRLV